MRITQKAMFDRVKDVSRNNDKSKYFHLRRVLSMDELRLHTDHNVSVLYIQNELKTLKRTFDMERYKTLPSDCQYLNIPGNESRWYFDPIKNQILEILSSFNGHDFLSQTTIFLQIKSHIIL